MQEMCDTLLRGAHVIKKVELPPGFLSLFSLFSKTFVFVFEFLFLCQAWSSSPSSSRTTSIKPLTRKSSSS